MQNYDDCESSKANSLKMTIWWLKENYEYSEGVSIPRKVLYDNYIRCCMQFSCNPISSATFGKIIRQQFPQITTRRLGTRGQSKYHYHGLSVKTSSPDFDPAFAKSILSDKEVNFVNIIHPKNRSDVPPTINISTLYQDSTKENGTHSDFNHFLVMYQTHSQQMLDSIIQGSFEEVGNFLVSFWRGCPENFKYLFKDQRLISCVMFIDTQVYLSIAQFVLPSLNHSLPDSYLKDFVIFLCSISATLTAEISDEHYELKKKKLKYAVIFKQMSLNWLRASHMLEFILPISEDSKIISQILEDFQEIYLEDVVYDVVLSMSTSQGIQFAEHFRHYFEEFENTLENNFSVEEVSYWSQMIYSQEAEEDHRAIYLGWSCFLSKFIDRLLLQQARSFVHVSLIFMWVEHLLYIQCILSEFRKLPISSQNVHNYETIFEVKEPGDNEQEWRLQSLLSSPKMYNKVDDQTVEEVLFESIGNVEPNNQIINPFNETFVEDNIRILCSL